MALICEKYAVEIRRQWYYNVISEPARLTPPSNVHIFIYLRYE